jgi:hypothetical protein
LNPAVRRSAAFIRLLFLIALGIAILLTAIHFRRLFHADESPGDANALAVSLIVASSYIIAIYPATLLTNLVWWFTPSMRNASKAANVGLSAVSFRSANLLLLAQAAIVVPICLAQIYLGSVMR